MPYRRRFKRRRTFRRFRRRRPARRRFKKRSFKRRRSSTGMIRLLRPEMPRTAFVCLRWQDRLVRAPGATIDFIAWAGNDCKQPWITTGSSSAMHFDEWGFFYNRYRVLASKFSCWIENTGTTNILGVLQANDDTSLAVTNYDQLRRSVAVRDTKGFFRRAPSQAGLQNNDKKITMYRKTSQIIQYSKNDITLSADIGASPSNKWQYTLQMIDEAEATNITSVLKITIDYYVEFSTINTKPSAS